MPLLALVATSYQSARKTYREAVAREASTLASEMAERMDRLRAELGQRLSTLSVIRWRALDPSSAPSNDAGEVYGRVVEDLRDLEPILDAVEFSPSAPKPVPPPPAVQDPSAPAAAPTAPRSPIVIFPSARLAESLLRLQEHREVLPDAAIRDALSAAIKTRAELGTQELEALDEQGRLARSVLGIELTTAIREDGAEVGTLTLKVSPRGILQRVLSAGIVPEGDVLYARSPEGRIFGARAADESRLAAISLPPCSIEAPQTYTVGNEWLVVEHPDAASGLTFGVARPIAATVRDLRGAALRTLGLGLALVALALGAIVFLATRLTRGLTHLTTATERLASGDLTVRVASTGRDEIGTLADAFNRMSEQLASHQQELVARELQQRLLEAENARTTNELEEARRLQLSLLPRTIPLIPGVQIAVSMETAAEVGGDYYDFTVRDGVLTVVIGDATGHGARAGAMVSVVKGLVLADAGRTAPADFLAEASAAIRGMELERMTMGLAVLRLDGRSATFSAAGMPPLLLVRAGRVEEILLCGVPLGGMRAPHYTTWTGQLEPGDLLLLATDGLPEAISRHGEPFGYDRTSEALVEAAVTGKVEEVIAHLRARVQRWLDGTDLSDDLTLVALRVEKQPAGTGSSG